jgi:hypothetical protein
VVFTAFPWPKGLFNLSFPHFLEPTRLYLAIKACHDSLLYKPDLFGSSATPFALENGPECCCNVAPVFITFLPALLAGPVMGYPRYTVLYMIIYWNITVEPSET